MAVVVPEVNAAAWVKMLRAVWTAKPSLAGARAVLRMCTNMLAQANVYAGELSGDHFTRATLKTWHADFDRAVARLGLAADGTSIAFAQAPDPESVDRISLLTAHTMGPVLDGVYPIGYCGDAKDEQCKGLVKRDDGTWKGMGVAFDVASLWNRIVNVWAVDKEQQDGGLLPNVLRDWLSQAETQLSESAPGEPETTYDAVAGALESAKNKVKDIAKAIGTRIVIYAAVGVGVVLGAYLLLRK